MSIKKSLASFFPSLALISLCVNDKMDESSEISLHYFHAKGRAELIRLIMVYCDRPFLDHRLKYSEWPKFKELTPIGELPVLEMKNTNEDESFMLCQSSTIVRRLASMLKIDGDNETEKAIVDETFECIRQLSEEILQAKTERNETLQMELFRKIRQFKAPPLLFHLERRAKINSTTVAGTGSVRHINLLRRLHSPP